MSYLECPSAPIPDMQKGIISLWFRQIQKQEAHSAPAKGWPQDYWTQNNAHTTMVPPNTQYSVGYDPAIMGKNVFFYNAYGIDVGEIIFGDLFLSAAACWVPNSPPVPQDTWTSSGFGFGGTDMSPYGVRTILAFGDTKIPYNYYTWRFLEIPVIDYIEFLPNVGIGPESTMAGAEPPYPPYINKGGPNGDGTWPMATFVTNDEPEAKFNMPPSFIGIDDSGALIINLQTNTFATYKGMSYEMYDAEVIWATYCGLKEFIPYSYHQLGIPFPDMYFYLWPGWFDGYIFKHRDISQKIMGAVPESFCIWANLFSIADWGHPPTVQNGGWHHLLFSFDISGEVTAIQNDDGSVVSNAEPKAWLAFDDVNYTGDNLQIRPALNDGFLLPRLLGTNTTDIFNCGPTATYGRSVFPSLGDNGILPRNAWLHGWGGNPKSGLFWFYSCAPLVTDADDKSDNWGRQYNAVGDFNWTTWTTGLWPLYWDVAPGPKPATYEPKRPPEGTDPSKFDVPQYSCSGFTLPTKNHPIAIPAGASMDQYNTGIEVAELQIWCNKTLDTGVETNRRLFINYPTKLDEGGKAVPDMSKPLQPVSPAVAAKVLGRPDILLHGSGDWQKGRNTGTSGLAPDGTVLAQGQFQPVGEIDKYKPEPKLGA